MLSDACPKAGRRYINAGWLSSGTNCKYTRFLTEGVNSTSGGFPTIHILRFFAIGVMAAGFSVLTEPDATGQQALTDARAAFYNASFEHAAALTLDLCAADDVDACELRSAALLMEIKRAIGDPKDKDKAFEACEKCQGLLDVFLRDTARGQAAARARLKANPRMRRRSSCSASSI